MRGERERKEGGKLVAGVRERVRVLDPVNRGDGEAGGGRELARACAAIHRSQHRVHLRRLVPAPARPPKRVSTTHCVAACVAPLLIDGPRCMGRFRSLSSVSSHFMQSGQLGNIHLFHKTVSFCYGLSDFTILTACTFFYNLRHWYLNIICGGYNRCLTAVFRANGAALHFSNGHAAYEGRTSAVAARTLPRCAIT